MSRTGRTVVLTMFVGLSSAIQIDSAMLLSHSAEPEPVQMMADEQPAQHNIAFYDDYKKHAVKFESTCTNPRGCDTTAKLMTNWASEQQSLMNLYTFGVNVQQKYSPKAWFPPTVSYTHVWDSFNKSKSGELTMSLATTGKAGDFFLTNGFMASDMPWIFFTGDLDRSGGFSKNELTDFIHLSIEVPGARMNKNALACWAGVWRDRIDVPRFCEGSKGPAFVPKA